MEETVKNLYPSYRGKTEDGQIIMEMVDRYGRTWGTGIGSDRVQAMYNARHAMPPKGIIRQVLQIAFDHPVKASLLAGIAVATYNARRYRERTGSTSIPWGATIFTMIATSIVSFVGSKILSFFFRH